MLRTLCCDYCGKEFERHDFYTNGKKHLFCSRQCCWNYASKTKNPDHYAELKDLSGVSNHMAKLNQALNPTRMSPQTREKIRKSLLGSGASKTYEKTYGRHTHRVVAENILGRRLNADEVVHHVDGNPRNNDPDNIRVFPSQKEHAELHAKLHAFFIRGGDAK